MKCILASGYALVRVALFCAAFTGIAAAQGTGKIRGVVTTPGPGGQAVPIPGVTVGLSCKSSPKGSLSTTTDETGSFSFSGLAPGTCQLVISATGFARETRAVQVKNGMVSSARIQLTLQTVAQRVEVHAQHSTLTTQSTAPSSTLNQRQMEALPLAEEKFRSALPVVPGVIRTPDGKLNIRGSPEEEGMLVVDSARTVDPVTGSFSVPVPIDAIRKLAVNKTPYPAQYGGFTGGLATIETAPPPSQWDYKLSNVNVDLRAKNGHLVGISQATPRLYFGGPLIPGKLNFSEAFEYEVRKDPVRGLSWPHNEIKTQGFTTFSTFQAFLSPQHLLTVHVEAFPQRMQFANIDALLPQTASSDHNRKGESVGVSDLYNFRSGALLKTVLEYTRFDSNAHGQGLADLLITPEGWNGNFFNSWKRTANQFEAFPVLQFDLRSWHGRHEISVGTDLTYRSFSGSSVSHPVQLLRGNGSLAEQINFDGVGSLHASATDVSEFVEDDWLVNDRLILDFGGRVVSQSVGREAAFAPRVGLAYSPGAGQKTVIRAGAGYFYQSVPLLAADFGGNPERVISLFDQTGQILGMPEVFQNAYVANGSGPLPERIRQEPNTSPRSFVTNFEVERSLSRSAALRLGYTYSQTHDLFVVNPLAGALGSNSLLALSNSGNSYDHELVATLHLQPAESDVLNLSYVWSRSRGDLNTLSEVYIPFEQPVIRPNVRGVLPSDIPNRLVGWGIFRLPWEFTISPVIDLHTGFVYSNVDPQQNYVGQPNGQRFPTFSSLDLKVYRSFHVPLPFPKGKGRQVRVGFYSLNVTNHGNFNAVYNDITASQFGQFAGFERRVNGIVLDIVN